MKNSNDKFSKAEGYVSRGDKFKKRKWEIRPHERKYALPTPGNAVDLNDETWYMGKRKDLADKYTSIPWTAIAGDSIRDQEASFFVNDSENTAIHHRLMVTGRRFYSIAVAGLIPALGNTNTLGSRQINMPWMTAAEQKIAYMQSKVSGSLPFAAADLVAYWFAAADIFAEIADAERALRIAKTWNVFENISLPRVLSQSLGWNYDAVIKNSRVFEGQIQEIIDLANTLLLPKDLTFVERWFFLYSNVFKDSNLPTAKLYAYRKDGYYQFDEESYDTGSACVFQFHNCSRYNYPSTATHEYFTRTPDEWFTSMMDKIYRLLPGRSTTVVDIMSKLLRAYDMSTFYAYGKVNATPIDIKFDPEALTAFANMSLTGIPWASSDVETWNNFDLRQDVNNLVLYYNGILFRPTICLNSNTILRAWEAHPDTGSMLEMTRLCACVEGYGEQSSPGPWMWTGTEIVTHLDIYNGDGTSEESLTPRYIIERQNITTTGIEAMQMLANLTRFAYMPALYFATQDSSWETDNQAVGYLADVDNYAVVTNDQMARIHRFAISSMWGVETSYDS